MLTLKRFQALVDSYGANLVRWPQEERSEAEALLAVSGEARTCLEQARRLDAVITSTSIGKETTFWPAGEEDAALARLRLGVEARIAREQAARNKRTRRSAVDWVSFFPLRWLGVATSGGFAVAMGLLLGLTYTTSPGPSPAAGADTDTVLAMLQPAPMQVLADFGGGGDESEKH
jgi:hypothetical protein